MEKWVLSNEIKKNMKKAKEAYDHYTAKSWQAKIDTMQPWEPLPERGVFFDDENRAAYNAALRSYGEDARDTLRLYKNDLSTLSAAAPSEAAARAVNVFALSSPGKDSTGYKRQVDNMIRAYGDNPIAHETIRTIAAKNGVYIDEHPANKAQRALDDIDMNINNFFEGNIVTTLERKADMTDGSIAFAGMMIDSFIDET